METSETHLATCEIYICNIVCDNKLKSLSDLKTHFVKKHKPEDKSRSVTHIKQSRKSKEEYDDEKTYLVYQQKLIKRKFVNWSHRAMGKKDNSVYCCPCIGVIVIIL